MLKKFDSYGNALSYAIDLSGYSKRDFAQKILDDGQKLSSLETQLSRWTKNKAMPNIDYRKKINESLTYPVNRSDSGEWYVSPSTESKIARLQEIASDPGAPYASVDLLIQSLESRLKSQAKETLEIAELLAVLRQLRNDS